MLIKGGIERTVYPVAGKGSKEEDNFIALKGLFEELRKKDPDLFNAWTAMHDMDKDKVDKIITDPNSQGKEYNLMREKLLISMKAAFPYDLDDGYTFVQKLKKEEPTVDGSRGRQTTLCSGYYAVGFRLKPTLTMAPVAVAAPLPVTAPGTPAALLLTPTAAPAPASASTPAASTASASASTSSGPIQVD